MKHEHTALRRTQKEIEMRFECPLYSSGLSLMASCWKEGLHEVREVVQSPDMRHLQ